MGPGKYYHLLEFFEYYSMEKQSGIKKITFLSGKQNEARDRSFLKRHQEAGTDLYAFIDKEKQKSQEILERHNRDLLNVVIEADDLANNDELSLHELQTADIKLKRHLKRLTDTVYKSVATDPEAALFVNEFKVEEVSGNEFIVNDGLNERIHNLYISKIPSIESSISILKSRIQYLETHSRAPVVDTAAENIYSLSKIPERLIYLKYSGVYDSIESQAKDRNAGKVNNASVAKIISHILNVKASSIEGLLGKLSNPHNVDAKNNPYSISAIEAALYALNEDGFDTAELYTILQHRKKSKRK